MERNFETVMIEQCAPVLASLKPAGLFRYETRDCADLARRVKNWNTQLNPKGLRVRVLKGCVLNHRYLVYVYRESRLTAVLADEKVQSFLRQEGYRLPEAGEAPDVGNMLTQLSRKLCCSAEFPHEIGVFLGYPLGDVVGFIENRGKNFTCCGCWKSYGDPDAAQKHFDQLSKCTAVYCGCSTVEHPFSALPWRLKICHSLFKYSLFILAPAGVHALAGKKSSF